MRSAPTMMLLLAFLAQAWFALPLRATDAGAAAPGTCPCCPCGGTTCCAAPDRPSPPPVPLPGTPVRLVASDELLTPPAPLAVVLLSRSPVASTSLLPPPPDGTAAAPLYLRGCALLI